MITKYHSLVRSQGRYAPQSRGLRYEQPISTFTSRPMMEGMDDDAESVARLSAARSLTPMDIVKESASGAEPETHEFEDAPRGMTPGEMAAQRGLEARARGIAADIGLKGAMSAGGLPAAVDVPSTAGRMGLGMAVDAINAGRVDDAYGGTLGEVTADPGYQAFGRQTPGSVGSLTQEQQDKFDAANEIFSRQINPVVDRSFIGQVVDEITEKPDDPKITMFDVPQVDPRLRDKLMGIRSPQADTTETQGMRGYGGYGGFGIGNPSSYGGGGRESQASGSSSNTDTGGFGDAGDGETGPDW